MRNLRLVVLLILAQKPLQSKKKWQIDSPSFLPKVSDHSSELSTGKNSRR